MSGTTKLKRVASLTAGGTPTVDEPNFWDESDGVPWVSIGDMSDGLPVDTTSRRVSGSGIASKRLPIGGPGTLLFAMYASVGAVGELAVEATWNQALLGIEPRDGLADRRFIRYWLEHLRPTLSALSRSNTQDNLNAEQVGNFPFPTLAAAEQRAIADYLDTETARIDALITKKRRMIELLDERRSIEIETLVRAAASANELPLKHAARDVTVGIVITPAAWYADDGVPAVRGVNVSPGKIDMNDCVYLTDEGHLINRKSTIRSGDVLVVRTGQAGAAAVVPDELDGTNCIDLLLIRPSERVAPRFLEYVLNSDWTMKHIEEHSVGTIQSHFNVGALRQLPIPLPALEQQHAVVQELDLTCGIIDDAMAKLRRQLDLLTEHRQALITAAVTGELEIPEAA